MGLGICVWFKALNPKTIDPNLLDCRVDGAFALLNMNQSERPPAMCDTYVHRSAS